jgi:chromosome segregation ATPase
MLDQTPSGGITGETILMATGLIGGIALGMMSLREKLRDYRAEAQDKQIAHLYKQIERLDKQLDDERADHETTRAQLRKAYDEIARGKAS